MGTKRALTPMVSEVIQSAQSGTMLDVFSGMCSVGESVAGERQVWSNDIQIFAAEVAKALFISRDDPLSAISSGDIYFHRFEKQKKRLSEAFARSIKLEESLIAATSYSEFRRVLDKLDRTITSERKRCRLRSPHLFASIYSGNYFGIVQAIEVDSIIAALREVRALNAASKDETRWCTIALGRALLKVANSTGHFAQYLKPKQSNYKRYATLRRRRIWTEWLSSLADLSPIGTQEWRKKNKVFNLDSLSLLPKLVRERAAVGVIYADPPYTDDQYSRFYHLLETLCLYDYPTVTGAGLYRPGRFQTPFSVKSKALAAIDRLIKSSARTGADLVLSYPTNGLANEAGADIRAMLRKNFRRVEMCRSVSHTHSTFGASKGVAQAKATELIYLARSV
jgi:adenine-specific DNA-methyltransferase